jgi:hypothetical protein
VQLGPAAAAAVAAAVPAAAAVVAVVDQAQHVCAVLDVVAAAAARPLERGAMAPQALPELPSISLHCSSRW